MWDFDSHVPDAKIRGQVSNNAQNLNGRPSSDPAIAIEKAEQQAQVQQVLAAMKPRAAKLLFLRHSGFSYAELADSLNLALGSIGTLLNRAERDFKARYAALYGGE